MVNLTAPHNIPHPCIATTVKSTTTATTTNTNSTSSSDNCRPFSPLPTSTPIRAIPPLTSQPRDFLPPHYPLHVRLNSTCQSTTGHQPMPEFKPPCT
nr:hypothetical transcript [Hymenolepis microstoma]